MTTTNPFSKYIALILFLLISCVGILLIISPTKEFSENENRYLQQAPKLTLEHIIDTSFMKEIEEYTKDQFPYKTLFLTLKVKNEELLGKTENNGVYIARDEFLIEKYNEIEEKKLKKIIDTISNFTKKLEGKTISIMLIPTSITFNKDKLPPFVDSKQQQEDLEYLYNNLKNIHKIDVTKTFEEQNKQENLFYRLDHHWTTTGAYYAYQTYRKSLKKDYYELKDWKKETVTTSFNGTLYSKANIYDLTPDSIDTLIIPENEFIVDYLIEKRKTNTLFEEKWLKEKDKYSFFLDNNHPAIKITKKNETNHEKLLIIKDSYANSFAPIIANNYQEVHIIDPRYYKYPISEYIKENTIDEILILYNMNTLSNDLGILSIQ